MFKVLCGHFCIACPRPLTRRYKALLNLVPLPTCVGELHLSSAASIVAMASTNIRAVQLGCLCQ
nr:hypothetical protein [Vibrio vulnificus]